MVLDSSALIAMLLDEPEAARFEAVASAAEDPILSAANLLEASMVAESRGGAALVTKLDELIAGAGVRIVAVDDMQAYIALEGFHRYGRGRSPANLNFGDCFAYALARRFGRPLLFKGEDFAQTNVERVA